MCYFWGQYGSEFLYSKNEGPIDKSVPQYLPPGWSVFVGAWGDYQKKISDMWLKRTRAA